MRCMKVVGVVAALVLSAGSSVWAAPTAKIVKTEGQDEALRFRWSLEAVQLDGLADAEVQRKVNADLKRLVREERERMALGLVGMDDRTHPSTLDVELTVTLLTDQLLSVRAQCDTHYEQRTHRALYGFNFDLVTGEELDLDDLVDAAPAARERLAELVDAALRRDPGNYWSGVVSDHGYRYGRVKGDDLRNAVLVDGKVRFLFGELEIGGGFDAGTTEVDLPVAELAGLLGPGHPSVTRGLAGALAR